MKLDMKEIEKELEMNNQRQLGLCATSNELSNERVEVLGLCFWL